jgi:hypothetical protein
MDVALMCKRVNDLLGLLSCDFMGAQRYEKANLE